ncbi:24244_t:CDS:2 [Gigaspora rosea]|nr:24244_t:CDS:2 [Gigaspora rosea]
MSLVKSNALSRTVRFSPLTTNKKEFSALIALTTAKDSFISVSPLLTHRLRGEKRQY